MIAPGFDFGIMYTKRPDAKEGLVFLTYRRGTVKLAK